MNRKAVRLLFMILFVLLTTICPPAFSKDVEKPSIEPGMPMPDFTLPAFQSGSVTLSDYKGRNVLLVFPRGLSGKARFCAIDNYRYAELMELEKAEKIREKYNVEILYVFPYSKKTVKDWVMKNPDQLKNIEKWKTPPVSDKISEGRKKSLERTRKLFPKTFVMEEGKVPTPFPILIDADRKVSKRLGIFSKNWGGSKVAQCIASVFIIDKKGDLRFKHVAKDPFDRPRFDDLIKSLKKITGH